MKSKIKSFLIDVHNWLIEKIVGKKIVIMNAKIKGTIEIDKKEGGLIKNCKIEGV